MFLLLTVLIEHKKVCFKANGKQSIKLKSGSINFKDYVKQLAAPFKIYADFESVLKGVQSNDNDNNASYTKKDQKHISCIFDYKVVCIDDKFSKPVVLYRGKIQLINLLKQFLNNMIIAKKNDKKTF